jgi:hypothetical protein
MPEPIANGATLQPDGNTIVVDETVPEEDKTETLSLSSLRNEVDTIDAAIAKAQARRDFIQQIFTFIGITYPTP